MSELWGLNADGSFLTGSTATGIQQNLLQSLVGSASSDVYSTVLADLNRVRNSLGVEIQRFEFAYLEPKERGRRLLFLFQKDLLPGLNSMIIENKGNRDFVSRVDTIEPLHNLLAWIFVVCLNVTLLFYIYLFAIQQTPVRQQAWFQTFLVWFVLEVFAVSTIVVVVTHFVIPSLVMGDLRKVKSRLLHTIRDFKTQMRQGIENAPRSTFNAADYFFVSSRLASRYPDITESRILSRFVTPWPHQSYQHTRSLSKSYSRRFSSLIRSASMIIVFILKGFLTMPSGVQDALMSIATVVTSGNFLTFMARLYATSPFLVLVPLFIVGLVARFIAKLIIRRQGGKQQYSGPKSSTRRKAVLPPVSSSSSSSVYSLAAPPETPSAGALNEQTSNRLKSRKQSVLDGVVIARELHSMQQSGSGLVKGLEFTDMSSSEDESNVKKKDEAKRNTNAVPSVSSFSSTSGVVKTVIAPEIFEMSSDSGMSSEEEEEEDVDISVSSVSSGDGAVKGSFEGFYDVSDDDSDCEHSAVRPANLL